ncbi:MAG TPA: hypothetical protein VIE15_06050, partial [Acidimicrobiales bacterium]
MQYRSFESWRARAVDESIRRARSAHRKVFCYTLALSHSAEGGAGGQPSLAVRASRVVPYAKSIRQHIRHRPGLREVDASRVLMGGQGGSDASAFAAALGTLRYGSTPMDQSPHVELLRMAAGRDLSDDELRSSRYYEFSHDVVRASGSFFGVRTDDEILDVTRNFIEWALEGSPRVTYSSSSPFEDNILVAKIAGSPLYQVIDGHHRVAAAIARGDDTLLVHRTWLSTETPLQRRLWEMSPSGQGGRVLAQPIPAPEVETGWVVTANCADRLIRMLRFLEQGGHEVTADADFLDVGSSLGWFVGEMKRFGHRVRGVEHDPRAADVGTSFLELAPDDVVVGDLTEKLEELKGSYDVVTCFTLPGVIGAPDGRQVVGRMIRSLDRVTGKVLFVDSDESTDLRARVDGPDESLTA